MIHFALAAGHALLRLRGRRMLGVGVATVLGTSLCSITLNESARRLMITAIPFYGGLALTWICVSGWLGRELRSGTTLLWGQLPASGVAIYGLRFLLTTGTALVLAGLQTGVVGALIHLTGPVDAPPLLEGLPGMLLAYLVLSTLVWTVGGWGVAGDGWAALLAGLTLSALELTVRLRPEWLGPAAAPTDAIGLPLDDLGIAGMLLTGPARDVVPALMRVFVWLTGCAMLGALGVQLRLRRPATHDRG